MSKYRHENSPIYIPGTDIPKNKLGIDDAELPHEIEANLLKDAYRLFHDELNENTVFFDMIAAFNGYEFIDYTEAAAPEGQSDNAYIKASIDCVQFANSKAMGAILFKGLVKIPGEENQL